MALGLVTSTAGLLLPEGQRTRPGPEPINGGTSVSAQNTMVASDPGQKTRSAKKTSLDESMQATSSELQCYPSETQLIMSHWRPHPTKRKIVLHGIANREGWLIMRKLVALVCLAGACLGTVAAGQELAVVEFDLYPSSFEPADICEVIPTWLLDQLSEYSDYQCSPAVLTREVLRSKRIIGEDLALTADAIAKLFQREGYNHIVVGSITVVPVIGPMTITASLVGRDGIIIESGSVTATTLEEAQLKMRDLCLDLLGLEPPSGNAPPIAKIDAKTSFSNSPAGATELTVYRNEPITLDAFASYDIDGEIIRYEWDVDGDNTIDEYQSAIQCDVLTSTPGRHVVSLNVVDSYGASSSEIITIIVLEDDVETASMESNIPPQPNIAVFGEDGAPLDRPAYIGESLTLSATGSHDPDGNVVSFSWDLNGDGRPDYISEVVDTNTLTDTARTITIQLTVTDELGMTSSVESFIETSETTISEFRQTQNLPPVVFIEVERDARYQSESGSPYVVFLNETIGLVGSTSYDPDGEIDSWRWDLEGEASPVGYRSTLHIPDLTAFPGQRQLTLEATDDRGGTSLKTITLTVLDYSADQLSQKRVDEEIVPVVRRAFSVLMGIGLIIGVGYLIWYFGW